MNRPFWSFRTSAPSDNCETIKPLLSLAADGMASPEESRRIDAHLPGCEGCRAALSWMQATRAAVASRPVAIPPPDLHSRIALAIALSSRPVAVPPPDLHSRIARAIAASSAAPVTLRPARVFSLRIVYAAAASVTVLGAALSYGLLHTPGQVTTKPLVRSAASVPGIKTPAAPKITKRALVASVSAKSTPIKHTIIAHKSVPTAVMPPEHIAFNDAPVKRPDVPQTIKALVHHAPSGPKIASRDISPTENHSAERHAPLPPLKAPAPKPLEGPRVAKIIKEPIHILPHLDIQPTKVTNDVPVKQVASVHETSNDPLGSLKVSLKEKETQFRNVSYAANQYTVRQGYQNATNMIRVIDHDRVPVIGSVYSPR